MHLYRYASFKYRDSAQELARYSDMMQGTSTVVLSQVNELRQDLKALFYRDAKAVYPYATQEWEYFKAQHWVLKDRNGNYVYSKKYGPKQYMLVDIGNSAYQYWLANKIESMITQGDFDGVFLDNSFSVTTSIFVDASGTPINPRTQRPWTNLQVENAYISILQKVKAAIGSKLLIPNGIWTGRSFYGTAEHYSIMEALQNTQLDGIMSEGIWNTYNLQWFTVDDWKKSLDFFIWIEENFLNGTNKVFVPVVSDRKDPAGSTHLQLATYGLASTLLAINPGETHVYLHLGSISFMANYGQALLDKANSLGNSIGRYYTRNGVYVRAFDHGKVYVNPTGTTVFVDGMRIAAHTGKIMKY
jgi:hypothetical protein